MSSLLPELLATDMPDMQLTALRTLQELSVSVPRDSALAVSDAVPATTRVSGDGIPGSGGASVRRMVQVGVD